MSGTVLVPGDKALKNPPPSVHLCERRLKTRSQAPMGAMKNIKPGRSIENAGEGLCATLKMHNRGKVHGEVIIDTTLSKV